MSTATCERDEHPDPAQPEQEAPIDWVATGACFTFPAIAGMLFGYDIGASSGVVASITSSHLSGVDWGPLLTPLEQGLLVGMSLFGAVAGSTSLLLLGDRIGRRTELLLASAFYAGGALLTGVAEGLQVLLAGRALYGLGVGLAMHAAPAYISETCPASVRGLLVGLKEAAIVGGILLGYIVSFNVADDVGGWRELYEAALPLSLALAVGMVCLPESPRWLLLAGQGAEAAKRALRHCQGAGCPPTQADRQLLLMEQSLQLSQRHAVPGSWELWRQSKYWYPLAVGCSLMLFQQVTGQPSVLYRAASILQDVGFEAGKGAASVAVLMGTFKLIMTMLAVTQVDRWGRRPLLLGGASGMVVALLVLGMAQSEAHQGGQLVAGLPAAWASVAALLLYVGCYQVSFGPVSWLMVGEIFPLRARGQAMAVASLTNWVSNFAVSTALPTLLNTFGTAATFELFAGVGVVAVVCMAATVPETKGKTLEEVEAMWVSMDEEQSGNLTQ